jgi:C1A family cysteine protease
MAKNNNPIIDIEQDPALHRRPLIQKIKQEKFNLKIPKFHLNKDKPDNRDYKYLVSSNVQKDVVDLRNFCSLIENQGNLGSCTGQAIAGAIELLNKRNRKSTDVSRLFIYYYERQLLGTVNYDSGAYIRDGIKVTNKQGAPLEIYWPYDIRKFKNRPSDVSVRDAAKRKVTLYERIENHNGVLDALNNGFPVIIGFCVYSSFMSTTVARTGIMPHPNTARERLLGGHAVLLVGYDKTRQVYIARNSWGSGWGDKGYFYMPFSVIQNQNLSFDFWTIKSVNNP